MITGGKSMTMAGGNWIQETLPTQIIEFFGLFAIEKFS